MIKRLVGKTCIITGAAQGMGQATKQLFLEEGANVVAVDVIDMAYGNDLDSYRSTSVNLRKSVTSRSDWKEIVRITLERFRSIDVLINNAGVFKPESLLSITDEEFERVLAINLKGPLMGIQEVAPSMLRQKSGSIVNIISTESFRGVNGTASYTSSKWGLRGLTKVAAMELGPNGIRVNALHPGATDTPMFNPDRLDADSLKMRAGSSHWSWPLQRVCAPIEIARASLFLACDEASFITGADLTVDGGLTAGTYSKRLPGGIDGPGDRL